MFNIEYLFEEGNYKGIIILLDSNFKVVRVNQEFLKLQGYLESDLYDKSLIDIVVPEDKSHLIDTAYTLEPAKEFTIQMYHKNGAFRNFTFHIFDVKQYKLLFGSAVKKEFISYDYVNQNSDFIEQAFKEFDMVDITEIVSTENKNLHFILNLLPLDVWIKDRLNRYVFVNKAYTSHTNYSFEDVYLKDEFQLFDPEIAQDFIISDQIAIERRKKINYTFESKSENLLRWTEVNKIPIFNNHGDYIGIIGISSDITEFKNVQNNYYEEASKFQALLKKTENIYFEILEDGTYHLIGGGSLIDNSEAYLENIKKLFKLSNRNAEIVEQINIALSGKETSFQYQLSQNDIITVKLFPFHYENRTHHLLGKILTYKQVGTTNGTK